MGVTYAFGQLGIPNGSYGYGGGYDGVGAIYVEGLSPTVEEWNPARVPYYTYYQPVLYKGLVYRLTYAWDGVTVGSPGSQVNNNGDRIWTLAAGGNFVEQLYTTFSLKGGLGPSAYQYRLAPCHTLFYSYFNNDLTGCMQRDANPVQYYQGGNPNAGGFSVDVGVGALATIPANLFKLIITNNRSHPSSDVGNLVGGIFDSLKDYPYELNGDPLGPLYHEESFTYTLTVNNWWMDPEYDASGAVNRTFTFNDLNGNPVNTVKFMWMIFIPETFLGRTYHGAFRVYKKYDNPNILIGRYELDTVTPDLLTD